MPPGKNSNWSHLWILRIVARTLLLAFMLAFVVACGLVPSSSSGVRPPPAGKLSISFIGVGQGNSILVQATGTNYLIDAGRHEEGPNVVDFLRSRGVEKLNGVVASHDDADHIGGLPAVFDASGSITSTYPAMTKARLHTMLFCEACVRSTPTSRKCAPDTVCSGAGSVQRQWDRNTQSLGLWFRALLTECGERRIQLRRI